ncbi:MAG TPA: stress response protein AzuC [Buttiauxella sp.]|nr:stress response protein AzuC [Buttiauxella sp.]
MKVRKILKGMIKSYCKNFKEAFKDIPPGAMY